MAIDPRFSTEVQMALALHAAHRVETVLLQDKIERLAALVREHDLPLPEDDPLLGASGFEHLAACRRVVIAAYDLLVQADELESALAELRHAVGSGMELVKGERWRK